MLRRARGFTLIELLLVLAILAVMAGLISLALGGNPHNALEREAKRLNHLLTLAAEEAIQRSVQIGFFSDGESYTLMVYEAEEAQWLPLESSGLKRHSLPDEMRLDSVQRDDPLALGQSGEQPLLILLSSGEVTPFTLELHHRELPDTHYRVHSDGVSGIYALPAS